MARQIRDRHLRRLAAKTRDDVIAFQRILQLPAHEPPVIVRCRINQVTDDFLARPLVRRRALTGFVIRVAKQTFGGPVDGLAEVVEKRRAHARNSMSDRSRRRRAYTSDGREANSRSAHLRRRESWARNDLLEG